MDENHSSRTIDSTIYNVPLAVLKVLPLAVTQCESKTVLSAILCS